MYSLLGHDYESLPFEWFSAYHMAVLVLFVVLSISLYVFRVWIRTHEKGVRMSMFGIAFTFETFYHIWLWSGDEWDLSFTLPLQLCSISLIIALLLLITQSKVLFQLLYFVGIAGALQALITPELFLGFPHFRFIQFFTTHILIILIALFYVVIKGYRPTGKGLIQAFTFLNISAACAFIANRITNGNYMFLAHKPENPSLLDYLGPYPYYILVLEAIALILFAAMFFPFYFFRKRSNDETIS
ncbi:TIGR02206 family membrane protein [Cytobacillus spongiae]|uniref:YwaF family protein n=1 Tax=Cytobacillus spongiae TaxID=2901381 RepID=UPI001F2FA946|nr:TIGR02206 family membrane protein [Cytobacillus spongiae]UII57696.1 TIGR02206 family membrane protein [Cytobacillus spongiae]